MNMSYLDPSLSDPLEVDNLKVEIDNFASSLKQLVCSEDNQLIDGVKKFLKRYNSMSKSRSTARLASAFHQFGWTFGGSSSSYTRGKIRHGKRIPVQATAAGRRYIINFIEDSFTVQPPIQVMDTSAL